MRIAAAVVTGLLMLSLPTWAEAQELTTEEIIQLLRPPANARSLGKTRGIAVENGEFTDKSSPTVNLYVNFAYNAAELEQDARIVLDRLAEALKDNRLIEWEFLIGGHTDAVGSDAYNLALSERRAMAVKRYLIDVHGINEQRLIEKGFGERRLLNASRPEDGVNRRVQITTLALPAQ